MERETRSAEETEAAGAELAARLAPGDVVEGPVTSPTFTIGHVLDGRPDVAHLDLYRLGSLAGEDPALLDDYLTPDRVAFLEWPEAAEPALDRVAARVRLEHLGEDRRRITIE